ncbi:enamine deaminase RidA (YjgF/YER057c/UK114 family) [Kribbella steppae]|uniref:Enamine deaminase RidA (YjgF/YER057c/UK114 family) n=1 Tax=Kribbella steppae TaxID=2512223 RepID=A0A4R2GZ41_9ACTN|nr:Rid family hydrolase [Kribbella steppae]TCO16546.1 enamine deaminase RidA (YjgF/YER057c/UK114 family) [Kribbella steppae]
MKRKLLIGFVVVVIASCSFTAGAAGWWNKPKPPSPGTVVPALPAGQSNPMIASGVGIGANTPIYKSSGLGPSALNTGAPAGSEASYIDTVVFPGGTLPEGVTITEAQGINVLRRIGENLQAQGLSYADVYTMRVFLQNPAGATTADFAGWNRAYRQYFANTDLTTGQYVPVPLGTAPPAKPFVVNKSRPSRFALEIENLPVTGWLVEVEVDAAYPKR